MKAGGDGRRWVKLWLEVGGGGGIFSRKNENQPLPPTCEFRRCERFAAAAGRTAVGAASLSLPWASVARRLSKLLGSAPLESLKLGSGEVPPLPEDMAIVGMMPGRIALERTIPPSPVGIEPLPVGITCAHMGGCSVARAV